MPTTTKTITHTVSGYNFHGRYLIRLRGPANGFRLSVAQEAKVSRALCGFAGCTCGGGYGAGPDRDSATLLWSDRHPESRRLVPANA